MPSPPQSPLRQRAIRNLPALSGFVGIVLIATFLLQIRLGDDELLNSYKNALRFADYLGMVNVVGVLVLNVFGLPIVASLGRREVNPHRAMLFRAARVLGCATIVLMPWFFEMWISIFGLFIIPPLVIIQASRVCSVLQRGVGALGALFFSHGSFVVVISIFNLYISRVSGLALLSARAFVPFVAFLSYAAVAMLLGAELLRNAKDPSADASSKSVS